MLGQECVDAQLAELQLCLDAEEGCAAADEGVVCVEADITGFDVFDDFVFIAGIGEVQA